MVIVSKSLFLYFQLLIIIRENSTRIYTWYIVRIRFLIFLLSFSNKRLTTASEKKKTETKRKRIPVTRFPVTPLLRYPLRFTIKTFQFPGSHRRKQFREIELQMVTLFLSIGLLILEKPLPLFNGRPNRFILTNGKHPPSLFLFLFNRTN